MPSVDPRWEHRDPGDSEDVHGLPRPLRQ